MVFIIRYIPQLSGGIIMGICTSALMGPVGILCLRRALEQERCAGVVTGIGATLGDFFHVIVTYLFTGIMLDYIDHNKIILHVVASMLLLTFACYLYFSTPRLGVSQRVVGQINRCNLSHLGSGFLLTILSLFIAPAYVVFLSQFNFVYPLGAPPYGMFALGLVSITLGALGWWPFIAYVAIRLRDLMSLRSLRIFNRIFTLIFTMIVIISLSYTFVVL